MIHTGLNSKREQLEEAYGNFKNIFSHHDLTFDSFRENFNKTKHIVRVDPLLYFVDVGNGMNPVKQKEEIEKVIPAQVSNPIERAKIAMSVINSGKHLGVSDEQYKKDLLNGKNHDATMLYFLSKVLNNVQLDPCIVVCTAQATQLFGKNVKNVILDGTHRAVVAATVGMPLDVIAFSMRETT